MVEQGLKQSHPPETESEGTWLIWNVKFGDSADAPTVAFACLKSYDKIALGDLD